MILFNFVIINVSINLIYNIFIIILTFDIKGLTNCIMLVSVLWK